MRLSTLTILHVYQVRHRVTEWHWSDKRSLLCSERRLAIFLFVLSSASLLLLLKNKQATKPENFPWCYKILLHILPSLTPLCQPHVLSLPACLHHLTPTYAMQCTLASARSPLHQQSGWAHQWLDVLNPVATPQSFFHWPVLSARAWDPVATHSSKHAFPCSHDPTLSWFSLYRSLHSSWKQWAWFLWLRFPFVSEWPSVCTSLPHLSPLKFQIQKPNFLLDNYTWVCHRHTNSTNPKMSPWTNRQSLPLQWTFILPSPHHQIPLSCLIGLLLESIPFHPSQQPCPLLKA